jgi:transcriptional regulator of acetoin/glycerol metabolism
MRTIQYCRTEPSKKGDSGMSQTLADIEKESILEAILKNGSVAMAAQDLGISRKTIYNKLKKYGVALRANELLAELRRQKKLPLSA